jgi:hypothetical protein
MNCCFQLIFWLNILYRHSCVICYVNVMVHFILTSKKKTIDKILRKKIQTLVENLHLDVLKDIDECQWVDDPRLLMQN